MAYLDQREITHFLAQELFQQFMTLEGLNSGVPTRTTPTVTPTTLRSIEQTFIELQKSEPHQHEAGFVPPSVHAIGHNQYVSASEADIYSKSASNLQNQWSSNLSQSSLSDCDTRSTTPLNFTQGFNGGNSLQFGGPPSQQQFPSSLQQPHHQQPSRRNMGGRKPKELNLSPEDEERRRVRRERNKAAAARCRKRRVDHTNSLVIETEELEKKRAHLQEQIMDLQETHERLEFALTQHVQSGKCRIEQPDIKPFEMYQHLSQNTSNVAAPINSNQQNRVKTEMIEPLNTPTANDLFILPSPKRPAPMLAPISKPSRPNSLNVGATAQSISDLAGIPISTPSAGMSFNFESLMGGGTGLTPVSAPLVPSCSTQQRNVPTSTADLSSPDACNPPKLVSL